MCPSISRTNHQQNNEKSGESEREEEEAQCEMVVRSLFGFCFIQNAVGGGHGSECVC